MPSSSSKARSKVRIRSTPRRRAMDRRSVPGHRCSGSEALVPDAVGLIGRGAKFPVAVFLVLGEVALEPANHAVALEGQHVGRDPVQEPAVVADHHGASREGLEAGLESFPGCAVVISHDRWFLDRIATHVLAFEGDSVVRWFEGNFTEYEEYRHRELGAAADQPHRIRYKRLAP